ncbi:hypothetical protein V8E36_003926 [Tilletia maclaganii]
MKTRGYVGALVAALIVLLLQLYSARTANWIEWSKKSQLITSSIRYGLLRTCTKLVVKFEAQATQQLSFAASSSASASVAGGFNASTLPGYNSDVLSLLSSHTASQVHAQEKDDGWQCRSFPQRDKDCNSEGDRAFCTAFLSAGYALQFSGILLIATMISSILTIFSHSPLNKVEGYRVIGGLLGLSSFLGVVAFAIVEDAYRNDFPYLWGAELSRGPGLWVELLAWLVGVVSSIGVLTVGFRAERGARTGSAPVDGYTQI